MRGIVALSWAIALACVDARAGEPAPAPILVVKASLSTAGPYGQSWYLTLTDDEAALQVFYTDRPSGSLMGHFTISEEATAALLKSFRTERFFELTDISPTSSPLHMPDFRLDVTLGGKRHKVEVYDPDKLKNDERAQRFLRVWNSLFTGLPLRPSW